MDAKNNNFIKMMGNCSDAYQEMVQTVNDFALRQLNRTTSVIDNMTDENKNIPEEKAEHVFQLNCTPCSVIYEEGPWKLLSYSENPKYSEPFLIIPSMINRYYILDLMEESSFIKYLVGKGINVYLVDWGTSDEGQDHLDLSHYIDKWISRAVNFTRIHSKMDKVTLLGYCMGGTMATIYTALYPEKVSGLISLASPYNFDTKDALSIFAQNLNVDAMVECFGQVPPEVLQYGFMIAQPGSVYGKMKSIYQNGDSEKRNRVFKHLERWLSDNIPFPGGVYREYITSLYQKNQLIKGEYVVNGRKVNLKNITVPFLNVTALRDNIVSSEAANPIMDVIGSEIKDKIEIDAGHIGVVMGKKAKEAWDCMSGWFYNRVIKKQ